MEGVNDHIDDFKPHVHSAWCLLVSTTVLGTVSTVTFVTLLTHPHCSSHGSPDYQPEVTHEVSVQGDSGGQVFPRPPLRT